MIIADLDKDMQKCCHVLMDNGYTPVRVEDELHATFKKTIDGNEFIVLLIGPHDGNCFTYILRGDFIEEHDRWSNATYQKAFRSVGDFQLNWHTFWFFDEDDAEYEE